MNRTNHKYIIGDARNMSKLADASVHLIITSPPYWQLKDYGAESQIGFHDSYEKYINNLNLVWSECFRVLHDGCRLCINIGDQFARSVYYGRYKVIPIRTEIIRFCEWLGMDYMGAIIWQKQTTMNTTGGGAVMGSFPYPRNGILKIDYEFILVFKKMGKAPLPTMACKQESAMTKEEWNTYFSSHWNFGGAKQDGHIAVFPEELPTRLIKMFSFVGETVLDPFMGSGTTALAAKKLGRNSIGYEIVPQFVDYYKAKLCVDEKQLFMNDEFEFLSDQSQSVAEDRMSSLPYIFRDPLKMDAKTDMKSFSFGSKIDKVSKKREDYYTVKEVLAVNMVKLSNGVIIHLLGIKEKSSVNGAASTFIREKTKGKNVFIKFDKVKFDENEILLAYLYLENRTFINAHLLKEGLADLDCSIDFKYRNKFEQLVKI